MFLQQLHPEPVLAACPSVASQATSTNGAVVYYTEPTAAEDAAFPGAGVRCRPASGSTFALGTTVVTCMASVPRGATEICAFNVTVRAPPASSSPAASPSPACVHGGWGP